MSKHHCSAVELFGSAAFLRVFTRVLGCGPCSSDGTAQGCAGHSEQFFDYVDLCFEHCPCPRHRGEPTSVIATRMASVSNGAAGGRGVLPDADAVGAKAMPGSGRTAEGAFGVRAVASVDRTAAHRLRDALDDVRRDRSYKNLRRVYPQPAPNGKVRCAFSERPRRWAQRRDVARVATDIVEQEALALLVLTAGWGNPAADLPEDVHPGESVSFTEDGSAVPVADLHGRSLTAVREPPMVSTATGDYLLRKLSELAGGRDADAGRTPDQRRRLHLRRLLPNLTGEDVARRLTGVLGRMAVTMPGHFELVQRARGRARSAPYTPVPDLPDEEDADAYGDGDPDPYGPRRDVPRQAERAWLGWLARELAAEAQAHRAAFDADPRGSLDALLCRLLEEGPRVPVPWRGAQDDPDRRADLLEALADAVDD
ncbi:hypothetical protein [Nocardiopsis sp. L17-MgMaSL7]|uniref:hypothetical protein n=1 Tax=Nocardiopsis sp. L17-MgMaSL7 TaxID=1938893 RepID=UPI000D70F408|nr:hypothetical protein [Nocardiopsis sp. L17-MgMaSL7]PWV46005.1 hypothetical protein BDW27_11559 [Nocardiopsis sp. L17-MgMaSL7]